MGVNKMKEQMFDTNSEQCTLFYLTLFPLFCLLFTAANVKGIKLIIQMLPLCCFLTKVIKLNAHIKFRQDIIKISISHFQHQT